MSCVIAGGDALVVMPTGSGKSLCYQIPALLRDGTAIVVSPLIALMEDQVTALRQLGIRAEFLNSSLAPEEQSRVRRQTAAGEVDLLYVAPERLLTDSFLAWLDELPLALFAIDEAHCVSQWGHDFRPEYLELAVLHERWPEVPRIALTATADLPTRREIASKLGLDQARMFFGGFDRPNICYRVSAQDQRARPADPLPARPAGRPGGHRLLPVAQADRGDRRAAGARGLERCALSRRSARGGAARDPAQLRHRRGAHHRGHGRVRDGHRQAGRALRLPPRSAEEPRGLLPGDRPRRPRRPAGNRDDDLGLEPTSRSSGSSSRPATASSASASSTTSSARCWGFARRRAAGARRCCNTSARR